MFFVYWQQTLEVALQMRAREWTINRAIVYRLIFDRELGVWRWLLVTNCLSNIATMSARTRERICGYFSPLKTYTIRTRRTRAPSCLHNRVAGSADDDGSDCEEVTDFWPVDTVRLKIWSKRANLSRTYGPTVAILANKIFYLLMLYLRKYARHGKWVAKNILTWSRCSRRIMLHNKNQLHARFEIDDVRPARSLHGKWPL